MKALVSHLAGMLTIWGGHALQVARLALSVLGVFAFIAAFGSSTPENHAGESGLYAALIAFCSASLALTLGLTPNRWAWNVVTWLGAMAAAYLWMVAESETSPFNMGVPLVVAVLSGIVGGMTAFMYLMFLVGRSTNRNDS